MVFLTIVRSSSSVLRPHRIQCAANCDSLSVHVAEIGQRWLARFRCCLVKMALRGVQGWPDKTSLAFGRKNATVALLQAFSRLVQKIHRIITRTKRCVPVILLITGSSKSATIPIHQCRAQGAQFFFTSAAA